MLLQEAMVVLNDCSPLTRRAYDVALRRLNQQTVPFDNLQLRVSLAGMPVNTRRSSIIAVKALYRRLGLTIDLQTPQPVSKQYDLPSTGDLELACMLSKHQVPMLLMGFCGLRLGETCTAQSYSNGWLDVQWQRSIDLQRRPAKTSGRVPVPARFRSVVESYTWPTLHHRSVSDAVNLAGTKLGIKLNPHMLRHFYVSTLISAGVDVHTVSKLARHSDIRTTLNVYHQLNDSKFEDAVNLL